MNTGTSPYSKNPRTLTFIEKRNKLEKATYDETEVITQRRFLENATNGLNTARKNFRNYKTTTTKYPRLKNHSELKRLKENVEKMERVVSKESEKLKTELQNQHILFENDPVARARSSVLNLNPRETQLRQTANQAQAQGLQEAEQQRNIFARYLSIVTKIERYIENIISKLEANCRSVFGNIQKLKTSLSLKKINIQNNIIHLKRRIEILKRSIGVNGLKNIQKNQTNIDYLNSLLNKEENDLKDLYTTHEYEFSEERTCIVLLNRFRNVRKLIHMYISQISFYIPAQRGVILDLNVNDPKILKIRNKLDLIHEQIYEITNIALYIKSVNLGSYINDMMLSDVKFHEIINNYNKIITQLKTYGYTPPPSNPPAPSNPLLNGGTIKIKKRGKRKHKSKSS